MKIRNSPEFPILIMNLVNFIALGLVIGRHSLGYELWLAFHIPPFLLFIAIASSAGWLLTKRKTGVIAAVAASFLVLSFYSVLASLSYFAANLFVMVSGVLFYAFNALLEKQVGKKKKLTVVILLCSCFIAAAGLLIVENLLLLR